MSKEINLQSIAQGLKQVDEKTGKEFLEAAKDLVSKGRVNIHFGTEDLNFDKANVVAFKENDNIAVGVRYKEKDGIVAGSVLSLVFNANKELVSYQELVIEDADENKATYAYFVDNKKIQGDTIDKDGEIAPQGWTSCMNNCLASMGLAGWVINLFIVLCAAACGTVILCVACIEGPLLAYTYEITYCLDRC
ncbi:hypothetical protein ACFVWC_30090 [Bacillus mycoides]|uniref:hypothetical protein n=1 Tax=Bacillus mycoides TaxID=1405 RepID=UPI0036E01E00